ncbi:MAG: 16S rRNA (cytidine(1402)-2'-O)-methyltransferase [Candidimonas sp.]|nr:MAG: 16S rRNA (cytidine(1402)-2'-O)-methyltransferase [Candidimonas sp.]
MDETAGFVDPGVSWNRLAERMGAQRWPTGMLYVVATPIGNLGDLSLRAWQTLSRCDAIAAEDTRTSRALLDAWGIHTPLIAAHRHNEAAAAQTILARLRLGERVALISDAGAPAISDPGARIVRVVREAGLGVTAVPGPSAPVTALMASGVTSDENPAFVFAGFPPPRAAMRQKWLQHWLRVPAPLVLFESPHRLRTLLDDLARVCGAARVVTIARELTKQFEQVVTLPLGDAESWLNGDSHRGQGEFVIIVHEAAVEAGSGEPDAPVVGLLDALLESLSVRDAARVASRVTGQSRDTLYALALERRGNRR